MTDSPDDLPTEALPSRRSMREGAVSSNAMVPVAPGQQATPPPAKRGGIAALVAKHPNAWLASALAVAFLLLGTGAIFAGISVGSTRSDAAPLPSASEIPPRPQPSSLPTSSALRSCSVNLQATDGRLAAFSGYVANATTGETLFDRNGEQAQRTGSVLKVLTAAAALQVLGPDARLTTQVLDGSSPGTIVLKGGGDPTLATSTDTVYDGAPQMGDLAAATWASYNAAHPGVPITQILLDSTLWNPDDNWDSSWLRKEQDDGYQAEVTALMVDGGRADPSSVVSSRSYDPIGDAGQALANSMGLDDVSIVQGTATNGTVLGTVQSQPISTLIGQMLNFSDNITGEMLARVTSKAQGMDGSSTSINLSAQSALAKYGMPVNLITIRDGSGLSDLNAVSPQFMSNFMIKVHAGEQNLGVIYSNLPVAGQSGTLASRFNGDAAIAQGAVIGKTGWLDAGYFLSGIINAADGTPLAFAFYSIRDGITEDAKDAQDTLAAAVFSCGNNLSNN